MTPRRRTSDWTYEEWQDRLSCTECGQPPLGGKRAWREWVKDARARRVREGARIAAMSPEEREDYDRGKALEEAISQSIIADFARAFLPNPPVGRA